MFNLGLNLYRLCLSGGIVDGLCRWIGCITESNERLRCRHDVCGPRSWTCDGCFLNGDVGRVSGGRLGYRFQGSAWLSLPSQSAAIAYRQPYASCAQSCAVHLVSVPLPSLASLPLLASNHGHQSKSRHFGGYMRCIDRETAPVCGSRRCACVSASTSDLRDPLRRSRAEHDQDDL